MSKRNENTAMYRRWIYMVVAILASVFMLFHPACRFLEDKGVRYVRSFSMTQTEITVTQTDLKTNADTVTATMSVKGLYFCVIAMIVGSGLCLLCFFNDRWRIILAIICQMMLLTRRSIFQEIADAEEDGFSD